MEDYTIAEEFELPSKGKVYQTEVNPNVKLRSMTTEEEMKRLGHSPYVYKMFSEMIDNCLVEKPGISAYDLCLGDYQYLLYKLRIVTYGPDYMVQVNCPSCGEFDKVSINLDSLEVNTYKDSFDKLMEFELPVSKKIVKIKLQTPRILDEVDKESRAQNSKTSESVESALLFNVMSIIDTVDGIELDDTKKEIFVRHLPMRDTNIILQKEKKLVNSIGINTTIKCKCSHCGYERDEILPFTGEFFRPSVD